MNDDELARLESLTADEILRRIHAAGFTEETVVLLRFVPLVQVAWADGAVTARERERVLQAARSQGVGEQDVAYATLAGWLDREPADAFYQRALEAIRSLLLHLGAEQRAAAQRDLMSYCTSIAAASGGLFGLGRISDEEARELELIAAELQRENEAAVRDVLDRWERIQRTPDLGAFP